MPLFWCSGLQPCHPDVKVALWSFHPSSLAPRNRQQTPLWDNLPSTSHHTSSWILDVSPTVTSPRHRFLHRDIHPALSGQSAIYSNGPNPSTTAMTLLTQHWNFFLSKSCFAKTPVHLKQSEKQKVPKRSGECGMRTGLCGRRHYETRESEFRITVQMTII